MIRFTKARMVLTLTGLTVLGIALPCPVFAQNLMYTLTGVTFDDGAFASGYFDYNPTSNAYGSFNLTTTNGVTDTLTGANYNSSNGSSPNGNVNGFIFSTPTIISSFNNLVIGSYDPADKVGTYLIRPGQRGSATQFYGSGEFAPTNVGPRAITAGSLIVTPVPIPESSSAISFGLLVVLSLGSTVIAAKKKKSQGA